MSRQTLRKSLPAQIMSIWVEVIREAWSITLAFCGVTARAVVGTSTSKYW